MPLMVGHRLVATSLALMGNLVEARTHYDQALALYDPARHKAFAARFGQDVGVTILSWRSRTLWDLGYPEAALADVEQAVRDARAFGQASTLIYALLMSGYVLRLRGDYAAASELLDELTALTDEKGTAYWRAQSILQRGTLFILTGKVPDGAEMINAGLTALRSTGATFMMPLNLTSLASAYAELGKFDDARRCIDEAATAAKTAKEGWCEAHINRTAGGIELRSPRPDAAKAQAYFEHALAVARQQQAKSWELRASMSLARLWRSQGKPQQALELLAPVYGWFTEGFDTRDLKEAKALLEELAA